MKLFYTPLEAYQKEVISLREHQQGRHRPSITVMQVHTDDKVNLLSSANKSAEEVKAYFSDYLLFKVIDSFKNEQYFYVLSDIFDYMSDYQICQLLLKYGYVDGKISGRRQ